MASIHSLVPKHKSDIATARLAAQAGYPAVEPILYDLLTWLQDCNWPVSHVIFDFLASIGAPLAPHIRRVFDGDDYIWQYWLIGLFRESPELYSIFRADIHRIASFPTPEEHINQLDELCAEAIADCEPPNADAHNA
jgi:hypothetical protein